MLPTVISRNLALSRQQRKITQMEQPKSTKKPSKRKK